PFWNVKSLLTSDRSIKVFLAIEDNEVFILRRIPRSIEQARELVETLMEHNKASELRGSPIFTHQV
ncbi:hypothetical protein MKX03_000072, partial [Papaver bracteatum]